MQQNLLLAITFIPSIRKSLCKKKILMRYYTYTPNSTPNSTGVVVTINPIYKIKYITQICKVTKSGMCPKSIQEVPQLKNIL